MTTTRQTNWRTLVEAAEEDPAQYRKDSRHPIVYEFRHPKRDTGPDGGPYRQDS